MNREILFKAKRIDNAEWVEGYLCYKKAYCFDNRTKPKAVIITEYSNTGIVSFEIDETTICQYTGFTDKNGQKIWKNDIVRCGGNLIVTWNEKFAGWCLTKKGWLYNHFFGEACTPEDVEVIGNIFDDPELLEGGAEE